MAGEKFNQVVLGEATLGDGSVLSAEEATTPENCGDIIATHWGLDND